MQRRTGAYFEDIGERQDLQDYIRQSLICNACVLQIWTLTCHDSRSREYREAHVDVY